MERVGGWWWLAVITDSRQLWQGVRSVSGQWRDDRQTDRQTGGASRRTLDDDDDGLSRRGPAHTHTRCVIEMHCTDCIISASQYTRSSLCPLRTDPPTRQPSHATPSRSTPVSSLLLHQHVCTYRPDQDPQVVIVSHGSRSAAYLKGLCPSENFVSQFF